MLEPPSIEMSEDNKKIFWSKLAHTINTYMASLEDNRICRIWIDDIINAEIVKINEFEKRVLASSYTSEDGGKSFVNYKISIETQEDSLASFEKHTSFPDWQSLEGKIKILPQKRRITINTTKKCSA